eukprot:TRINITY_DN67688_c0_g1_i1.p1 TRINITY_DN67688_c0_g1~~TRINITY_DN67688_c0_g1_i1.p1  ORF type:complete len:174 (-),score=20.19 TRINITY_DN67688_c0_g1_i1:264-707(-)
MAATASSARTDAATASSASADSSEAEADSVLSAVMADDLLKAVPEGFDPHTTLLVANLPSSATSVHVGAFLSWYAPVVRVHRLDRSLTGADASCLVSFVDVASAEKVLNAKVSTFPNPSGEGSRPVRVQKVETNQDTGWLGWLGGGQ